MALYDEALAKVKTPVPADMLMQMSGDLGNNGYLQEAIQLVEPCSTPPYMECWLAITSSRPIMTLAALTAHGISCINFTRRNVPIVKTLSIGIPN